jgi:hypothetical protein
MEGIVAHSNIDLLNQRVDRAPKFWAPYVLLRRIDFVEAWLTYWDLSSTNLAAHKGFNFYVAKMTVVF